MSQAVPGGQTQAGVIDQTGQAGAVELHLTDGPAAASDGSALKQQVVQLESGGGLDVVIRLLASIDARLAHLEEEACGFSID